MLPLKSVYTFLLPGSVLNHSTNAAGWAELVQDP